MAQKLPARPVVRFGLLAAVLGLAACGVETSVPDVGTDDQAVQMRRERVGQLFGPDTLTLSTDPNRNRQGGGAGGGIGVNAFLWRASLDTIDFMPLVSADPFGGVIITEWYSPPNAPDERLKVNVFILDTALRADGLRASVFRQVRAADGSWRDAPVEPGTARQLEDTILTRARELRIAAG
jgi:hypothetical protein